MKTDQKPYRQQFIELALECDVLQFGEFELKSGRISPYFFNAGRFSTGSALARLGRCYAAALMEATVSADMLFGPAYKGIPLVATASIGLAARGRDIGYLFNRKEAKDHGEGGVLVGALPSNGDRVLIVEDVTTAGTSIRETVPILQAHADVDFVGVFVSADRQDRGTGERSALAQVAQDFSMTTRAIVTLDDIVDHLHTREVDGVVVLDDGMLERIHAYREQFGA